MSPATPYSWIGLLAGLLLAIAGAVGGAGAFFGALVLAAVGWVVGAQAEGRIDLVAALSRRSRG